MKLTFRQALIGVAASLLANTALADTTAVTIGGGPYLDIPQLSVAMDQDLWAATLEIQKHQEMCPIGKGHGLAQSR